MSDEDLAHARMWIAQAWCTPANSHKVMDVDLAEACAVLLAAAVREDRWRVATLFEARYGTFHDIGTAEVCAFLWARNVHDAIPLPPEMP